MWMANCGLHTVVSPWLQLEHVHIILHHPIVHISFCADSGNLSFCWILFDHVSYIIVRVKTVHWHASQSLNVNIECEIIITHASHFTSHLSCVWHGNDPSCADDFCPSVSRPAAAACVPKCRPTSPWKRPCNNCFAMLGHFSHMGHVPWQDVNPKGPVPTTLQNIL